MAVGDIEEDYGEHNGAWWIIKGPGPAGDELTWDTDILVQRPEPTFNEDVSRTHSRQRRMAEAIAELVRQHYQEW
jgi:hypothetical protein